MNQFCHGLSVLAIIFLVGCVSQSELDEVNAELDQINAELSRMTSEKALLEQTISNYDNNLTSYRELQKESLDFLDYGERVTKDIDDLITQLNSGAITESEYCVNVLGKSEAYIGRINDIIDLFKEPNNKDTVIFVEGSDSYNEGIKVFQDALRVEQSGLSSLKIVCNPILKGE